MRYQKDMESINRVREVVSETIHLLSNIEKLAAVANARLVDVVCLFNASRIAYQISSLAVDEIESLNHRASCRNRTYQQLRAGNPLVWASVVIDDISLEQAEDIIKEYMTIIYDLNNVGKISNNEVLVIKSDLDKSYDLLKSLKEQG